MNYICEYVGFSEEEIEKLTERIIAYMTNGRFPLDS
jgi:CRISPR/Cas system type I-B associated protein Csh2 (Cas7 group RAMP superfamily)